MLTRVVFGRKSWLCGHAVMRMEEEEGQSQPEQLLALCTTWLADVSMDVNMKAV